MTAKGAGGVAQQEPEGAAPAEGVTPPPPPAHAPAMVEPAPQPESPKSDPASPARRPRRHRWMVALALLALVGGALGIGYRTDAWDSLRAELGQETLTPLEQGLRVAPPPGVALPGRPVLTPYPGLAPGVPSADAVRRALAPALRNRAMGPRFAVAVADQDGLVLAQSGPRVVVPASTLKLLTSAAALEVLGGRTRLQTDVRRIGSRLSLVGGGDPLLLRRPGGTSGYPASADLTTLARRTAQALKVEGLSRVQVSYDNSIFAAPARENTWETDYLSDFVVSPITGLSADQGRLGPGLVVRSADPSRAAAAYFVEQLQAQGIRARLIGPAMTPPEAVAVASVVGPSISQLVAHTLEFSDNEAAEALAHLVGARAGSPSFDGAATATLQALRQLGVNTAGARLHDGSGLSRANRISVQSLLDVLQLGRRDGRFVDLIAGLPVAGFNGTLAYRFEESPATPMGVVRAKTGTLTGVSGYAGTVQTRDGLLLTFVAIADRIRPPKTVAARAGLDAVATALADCLCGQTP